MARQPEAFVERCPCCGLQKVVGGGVGVLMKNEVVTASRSCERCVEAALVAEEFRAARRSRRPGLHYWRRERLR